MVLAEATGGNGRFRCNVASILRARKRAAKNLLVA